MAQFCLFSLLSVFFSLVFAGNVTISKTTGVKTCTVFANGNHEDDVPHIMKAFGACGINGTVVFPEGEIYWIGTKLNPVLSNVIIQWRGLWQVHPMCWIHSSRL